LFVCEQTALTATVLVFKTR